MKTQLEGRLPKKQSSENILSSPMKSTHSTRNVNRNSFSMSRTDKSSIQQQKSYSYLKLPVSLSEEHEAVMNYIEDMDSKMNLVVEYQKGEVFQSYLTHMSKVKNKLKNMIENGQTKRREVLDDPQILKLEQERNWFREEALKLKQYHEEQSKVLNKLKHVGRTLKEDKDYLLAELLKQKQENVRLYGLVKRHTPFPEVVLKKLEIEAEMPRVQASHLTNITPVGPGRRESEQPPLTIELTQQDNQRLSECLETGEAPASSGKYDESLRTKPRETSSVSGKSDTLTKLRARNQELEDDEVEFQPFFKTELDPILSPISAMKYKYIPPSSAPKPLPLMLPPSKDFEKIARMNEERKKVERENKELKQNTTELDDVIRQMQRQLKRQQCSNRNVTKQRVDAQLQQSELEEFFISCLAELRKQIIRNRNIPLKRLREKQQHHMHRSVSGSALKSAGSSQLRPISSRSAIKIDGGRSAMITPLSDVEGGRRPPLDQEEEVGSDTTSIGSAQIAHEKKKTVEALLSNQEILSMIHSELFPPQKRMPDKRSRTYVKKNFFQARNSVPTVLLEGAGVTSAESVFRPFSSKRSVPDTLSFPSSPGMRTGVGLFTSKSEFRIMPPPTAGINPRALLSRPTTSMSRASDFTASQSSGFFRGKRVQSVKKIPRVVQSAKRLPSTRSLLRRGAF